MQGLNLTSLLIAFFSGVGATVLGFLLTLLWELKKMKDSEKVIFNSLKNKLEVNLDLLNRNLVLVEKELALLKDEQMIVAPLHSLDSDFLTLLSFSNPKKIRTSPEFFSQIVTLSGLLKGINETIQSRELYRINNGAMDNYGIRLGIYDNLIKEKIVSSVSLTKLVLPKFEV